MSSQLYLCTMLVAAGVWTSQANILDTAKANGCSKLVSIISDAGLTSVLANAPAATLFAPSDAAVAALPADVYNTLTTNRTLLQEVLKFHALPSVKLSSHLHNDQLLDTFGTGSKIRANIYNGGKLVTAQGSAVTKADLVASNGVVHVIDRVIYPLPALSIPLVLTFDKDLNNLGYLVYQANLIPKFSDQSYTVFAPTNEAIEKIPGQEYNNLLMNITKLTSVLSAHVVQGTVFSAALSDGQKMKSLEGAALDIQINSAGVIVNGARVQRADLSATNGVIHVIDKILLPPELKSAQTIETVPAPVIG